MVQSVWETNQIRLKASFDLNEIALGTKGSFAKIPPLRVGIFANSPFAPHAISK